MDGKINHPLHLYPGEDKVPITLGIQRKPGLKGVVTSFAIVSGVLQYFFILHWHIHHLLIATV